MFTYHHYSNEILAYKFTSIICFSVVVMESWYVCGMSVPQVWSAPVHLRLD